jgi:hypothetical protein
MSVSGLLLMLVRYIILSTTCNSVVKWLSSSLVVFIEVVVAISLLSFVTSMVVPIVVVFTLLKVVGLLLHVIFREIALLVLLLVVFCEFLRVSFFVRLLLGVVLLGTGLLGDGCLTFARLLVMISGR